MMSVALVVMVMCAVHVSGLVDNTLPPIFYPFGPDLGDNIAPVNDDGYTDSVAIGIGFPFFNTTRHSLFVSISIDLYNCTVIKTDFAP